MYRCFHTTSLIVAAIHIHEKARDLVPLNIPTTRCMAVPQESGGLASPRKTEIPAAWAWQSPCRGSLPGDPFQGMPSRGVLAREVSYSFTMQGRQFSFWRADGTQTSLGAKIHNKIVEKSERTYVTAAVQCTRMSTRRAALGNLPHVDTTGFALFRKPEQDDWPWGRA